MFNMSVNRQFIRFLLVGLLNTLVGFSLYALFLSVGMHYSIAVCFSTVLGVIFNFFTTGRLVFQNTDKFLIIRFILIYCFVCVINIGLVKFCLILGLNKYAAYFLSLPAIAVFTFILMRQFVFTKNISTALRVC